MDKRTKAYKKHKRDLTTLILIVVSVITLSAYTRILKPVHLAEASGEYIYNYFPESGEREITYPISPSDQYKNLLNTNKTFKDYVNGINVRNNNPGNLLYAGQPNATKCDPRGFACFPTIEIGFRALVMQVSADQNRDLTIESWINRYSPPHENDTEHLIREASRKLNTSRDTRINTLDIIKLAQVLASQEFSVKIIKY